MASVSSAVGAQGSHLTQPADIREGFLEEGMPETNPRLGRPSQSKVEQKSIVERGQERGKVSSKETWSTGGTQGLRLLQKCGWKGEHGRERAEKKSMEGLRCQLESPGLTWQAVGSYQGRKQFRVSKTEQHDAAAGWRRRQKGQAGGQGPRQNDGNYTSQAGNDGGWAAEGGWGAVARSQRHGQAERTGIGGLSGSWGEGERGGKNAAQVGL